MNEILRSLRPFAATVISAGLAWVALQSDAAAVGTLFVAAIVIMFFASAFEIGANRLPGDPVNALQMMEWAAATQWVVAAVGPAIVIVLGVKFAASEDLSAGDEAAYGAAIGGMTAFITSTVAALSGEKGEERSAKQIKAAFQAAYVRPPIEGADANPKQHYFLPSSPGERWVHSEHYQGASGWGRPSRRKRAQQIALELGRETSNANQKAEASGDLSAAFVEAVEKLPNREPATTGDARSEETISDDTGLDDLLNEFLIEDDSDEYLDGLSDEDLDDGLT